MKTSLSIFTALSILVPSVLAHTGGQVKMVCPLDATAFQAWQDLSGTSFGARLDLKKNGPIAQPWALAQCPKCRLPLYKDKFTESELKSLREVVARKRFIEETRGQSAYFALGVLFEELGQPPFDIAWAYLQASWEAEQIETDSYNSVAKRAIKWFDLAAVDLKSLKDKTDDCQIALHLSIELSRRIGDFAGAAKRLTAIGNLVDSKIKWMPAALQYERQLTEAKDTSPHDIGENQKKE